MPPRPPVNIQPRQRPQARPVKHPPVAINRGVRPSATVRPPVVHTPPAPARTRAAIPATIAAAPAPAQVVQQPAAAPSPSPKATRSVHIGRGRANRRPRKQLKLSAVDQMKHTREQLRKLSADLKEPPKSYELDAKYRVKFNRTIPLSMFIDGSNHVLRGSDCIEISGKFARRVAEYIIAAKKL